MAALVVCGIALCGCAAVKATQQPGKKNLEVLNPGTPRTHVIAELGAPMWSEERDGETVDVFAFKQGYSKGAKAGRALLHVTGDVLTWGLWEIVGIPAESLADGSDVKVEITYDHDRNVKSLDVIAGQDVITPRRWFRRKSKPAKTPPVGRRGRGARRSREPTIRDDAAGALLVAGCAGPGVAAIVRVRMNPPLMIFRDGEF